MPANTSPVGLPYPLGTDPVRDGDNDIRALAEEVDKDIGLIKRIPTSVSGTGATVDARGNILLTATPSSGAKINGVFDSTWPYYKILISGTGSSASVVTLNWKMTAAGTENSTNYNHSDVYNTSAAGPTRYYPAVLTAGEIGVAVNSRFGVTMDVMNPGTANPTQLAISYQGWGTTNSQQGSRWMLHNVSTAYDGFMIYPASGTITCNVRVFAYGE